MAALVEHKDLFGGALSANIPKGFVDASTIRQVPDHQEVFLDPHSNASLVIEILDIESVDQGLTAATHHFKLLANDNEAISYEIFKSITSKSGETDLNGIAPLIVESINLSSNVKGIKATGISLSITSGTQKVPKYNHTSPDTVFIAVAVITLSDVDSDILISINIPIDIAPSNNKEENKLLSSEPVVTTVSEASSISNTIMNEIVKSFKINNWSLFG